MKYRCPVDPVLQSRMSRGTLMLYCLLLYITVCVCVFQSRMSAETFMLCLLKAVTVWLLMH